MEEVCMTLCRLWSILLTFFSLTIHAIKTLESELSATKQKLLETTHSYEHEVEMLKISKSALQRSHDDLEASLREARSEVVSLKATVSQMAADSSAIQCQLEATKVGRGRQMGRREVGGWEVEGRRKSWRLGGAFFMSLGTWLVCCTGCARPSHCREPSKSCQNSSSPEWGRPPPWHYCRVSRTDPRGRDNSEEAPQ